MKRTGLIALCFLLAFSLPVAASSKNSQDKTRPHTRTHKAHKPQKSHAHSPSSAKPPPIGKKHDYDPTKSWQNYSYP